MAALKQHTVIMLEYSSLLLEYILHKHREIRKRGVI
jgi:hypothetical protein